MEVIGLRVSWRGRKTCEGSLAVGQRQHDLVMWGEGRIGDRLVAKMDCVAKPFCFSGFNMAVMHTVMFL